MRKVSKKLFSAIDKKNKIRFLDREIGRIAVETSFLDFETQNINCKLV
jgi:hypothetical protein